MKSPLAAVEEKIWALHTPPVIGCDTLGSPPLRLPLFILSLHLRLAFPLSSVLQPPQHTVIRLTWPQLQGGWIPLLHSLAHSLTHVSLALSFSLPLSHTHTLTHIVFSTWRRAGARDSMCGGSSSSHIQLCLSELRGQ